MKVNLDIYADCADHPALEHRDTNVSLICHVEADISRIPEHMLARTIGVDGQVSPSNSECAVLK